MQENIPSRAGLDEDLIYIKDILSVLWSSKLTILLVTSIFSIFSIFYALSLPDIYKSESTLTTAVSPSDNFKLQGALASIAGINMGSGEEDMGAVAIEIISSRGFLKHLLTFDNIMVPIMASVDFEPNNKKLIIDSEQYDSERNEWIRKSEGKKNTVPTYLEVYENYLSMLRVNQDPDTGFYKVSIEHLSPLFAKEFLDLIISEVNSLMRSRELEESGKALEYLKLEASKTTVVGVRDLIHELIQSQLERQMLAKMGDEYVLKIIEPPFIAEEKSAPNRAQLCILITLLGAFFSVIMVLFKHYQVKSS